jgi:hypothetical protein
MGRPIIISMVTNDIYNQIKPTILISHYNLLAALRLTRPVAYPEFY